MELLDKIILFRAFSFFAFLRQIVLYAPRNLVYDELQFLQVSG